MAMLGHALRLSRTNTYGWVPLCECGWIGNVVPATSPDRAKTARGRATAELTQARARVQHGEHLLAVRAELERESERVLAAIGSDIKAANSTLQRRGRWGQP